MSETKTLGHGEWYHEVRSEYLEHFHFTVGYGCLGTLHYKSRTGRLMALNDGTGPHARLNGSLFGTPFGEMRKLAKVGTSRRVVDPLAGPDNPDLASWESCTPRCSRRSWVVRYIPFTTRAGRSASRKGACSRKSQQAGWGGVGHDAHGLFKSNNSRQLSIVFCRDPGTRHTPGPATLDDIRCNGFEKSGTVRFMSSSTSPVPGTLPISERWTLLPKASTSAMQLATARRLDPFVGQAIWVGFSGYGLSSFPIRRAMSQPADSDRRLIGEFWPVSQCVQQLCSPPVLLARCEPPLNDHFTVHSCLVPSAGLRLGQVAHQLTGT
ncbi:hypothetical protein GE09DRAFT_623948 [Coniochaeta sp. 2T2.1]|nr:hypothetical protein GE09DRAFT_623948 [Coniochaeta sp. 2T2.1]